MPDFHQVVAATEKRLGHASQPGPVAGMVTFEVPDANLNNLIRTHAPALRRQGAYLFVHDRGFGQGAAIVALADTVDQFAIVEKADTDGANYGHDNAAVIAWLRALHAKQPFALTGAGRDFVEGRFLERVRDPEELAQIIHAFCPDFYNQGLGLIEDEGEPHQVIADHFKKNQSFFFWWD